MSKKHQRRLDRIMRTHNQLPKKTDDSLLDTSSSTKDSHLSSDSSEECIQEQLIVEKKELHSTSQENDQTNIKEETEMDKLILDQPDIVTDKGTIEHVLEPKKEVINDSIETKNKEKKDHLINEDPCSGIVLLD